MDPQRFGRKPVKKKEANSPPVSADYIVHNLQTAADWVKWTNATLSSLNQRQREARSLFIELDLYFGVMQPDPDSAEGKLWERIKQYLYS